MNAEFKPAVPETPGSWEGSGQDWQFKKADGTYAKGEWIGSNGDWYYKAPGLELLYMGGILKNRMENGIL